MATVSSCQGAAGRLIRVGQADVAPLIVSVNFNEIDESVNNLSTLAGVATRVDVSQQVAAQFQNSLSNLIFITPFGDVPGDIRISFVTNVECGQAETSTNDGLIQFYRQYRLQTDANKIPAIISVGGVGFLGYLVGMSYSCIAEGTPLRQGTLMFKAWLA